MASAASSDPLKEAEALDAAIENLSEAENYFAEVDCKELSISSAVYQLYDLEPVPLLL